ncbi:PiggyBac transposable element-derived protein 4 [Elysia marginata]|uniref:PiggyBac transposable element-derived protein 4 n=1 Tax=Elysia marginata TaxID=1093978 RepID=A0AAV4JNK5_9GAST|nr:PiggyBac transposable element-derived protein 4 [Elysia marginata]
MPWCNRLIAPYLEEGRTLFVDNCYPSPDLFTYLKQHKTLACGALLLNRKNSPPKAMLPKLKKACTTTSSLTKATLNPLRFYDKCAFTSDFSMRAHDALFAWATLLIGHTLRDTREAVVPRLRARHFPELVQPKKGAIGKNPVRDCPVNCKRTRYEC